MNDVWLLYRQNCLTSLSRTSLWQILSGRNGTNVERLSQTAVLVSHSCPAGSRSHWTAVSNSGLLLHISSGVVLINVILKSWTSSPQSFCLPVFMLTQLLVFTDPWSGLADWPCADEALRVWSALHVTQRRVAVCMCAGRAAGVAAAAAAAAGRGQMARCAAASGASWPCGATTVPWHMSSVRWTGFLTLKITSFNTWAQI